MSPLFNSIMLKGAQEQSLYLFSRKQPNDNLFQARTGNDVSLYLPVIYLDFIAHKTDRIGFPYVPTRSDCNVFNEPIERTEILAWAWLLFSVLSLILETVYSLLILANDPPLISNHASGFRTNVTFNKTHFKYGPCVNCNGLNSIDKRSILQKDKEKQTDL